MGRSHISQKQKLHRKTHRLTALDAQSVLALINYSSGRKRRFLIATVIAASGIVPAFSHHSTPHVSLRNLNTQTVVALTARQPHDPHHPRIAHFIRPVQRAIRMRLSRAKSLLARARRRLDIWQTIINPTSRYAPASQTVRGSPVS